MSTATVGREKVGVRRQETKLVAAGSRVAPQPGLFANVLLETSETERRRRKFSALLSLVLQCLSVGTALLIPLWFTDALPKRELWTMLLAPPPPPPPAALAARTVQRVTTEMVTGTLRVPGRIPDKVQMIKEEEPAPSAGMVGGVPGGIPGGQLGGVIGGILSSAAKVASVPKLSALLLQRIRISQGVTKGQLLEKVEAKYPPIALAARIQGDVVLTAIISKTGEIENLDLVKGHPMLVPAAIHAVQQWRYRPFLLNGVAVEVETVVTVTFRLAT